MNDNMQWHNLQEALNRFLVKFIETYKQNLVDDGKSATGNLVHSIQWPEVTFTGNGYEGTISIADYWKYVEYGRRPGKFPPPNVLINWIKAKPILPRPYDGVTPSVEQLAFLIGRKIAEHGIEPGGQMEKSFDDVFSHYEQDISDAIARDIEIETEVTFRSLV